MTDLKIKILRQLKDNEKVEDFLPSYQTQGSVGMDLKAWIDSDIVLEPGTRFLVPTGLAIEVSEGYEAQIRPRSGLAIKNGIFIVNSPGTIDSDYRGEVQIIIANYGEENFTIKRKDRIAQMVINKIEKVNISLSENLSTTDRSSGGFGHTGV
ncbi:MAG: dUTP diphosphatase [Pseudomonadota bacterium]